MTITILTLMVTNLVCGAISYAVGSRSFFKGISQKIDLSNDILIKEESHLRETNSILSEHVQTVADNNIAIAQNTATINSYIEVFNAFFGNFRESFMGVIAPQFNGIALIINGLSAKVTELVNTQKTVLSEQATEIRLFRSELDDAVALFRNMEATATQHSSTLPNIFDYDNYRHSITYIQGVGEIFQSYGLEMIITG